MQCEEVREQFTDYLTEQLPEPVRAEVQQHLISCATCRTEAEALKTVWKKLDSIPAETADSAAMRSRFNVMIEAYRQGMDHAPSSNWWNSINGWIAKWWPQQPALQFGLALVLLGVGITLGMQHRSSVAPVSQEQDVAQLRNELHDMNRMVALSLMQQQSASDRLKGVNWSNQIDQPDSEVLSTLLDTLMHDSNVNVRLASVDALRKFAEHQGVRHDVVQALAKEDSPLVQVALIDLVVDLKEKDSVDTLRKISQDTSANDEVRNHAEWGLEQLQ